MVRSFSRSSSKWAKPRTSPARIFVLKCKAKVERTCCFGPTLIGNFTLFFDRLRQSKKRARSQTRHAPFRRVVAAVFRLRVVSNFGE